MASLFGTFAPSSSTPATQVAVDTLKQNPEVNVDVVVPALTQPSDWKRFPKLAEMVFGAATHSGPEYVQHTDNTWKIPTPNPAGFVAGDLCPACIKVIEVTTDGEDTETGNLIRAKGTYVGGYGYTSYSPGYSNIPANTTIRINPVPSLGYSARFKFSVAASLPYIEIAGLEA